MLSKIAGVQYGTAKKANPVIVRIGAKDHSRADLIEELMFIIDDWKYVRERAPVKVGIINMSWGFYATTPNHKSDSNLQTLELNQMRDLLNEAVEEGLLPICAAGNFGGVSTIASTHYSTRASIISVSLRSTHSICGLLQFQLYQMDYGIHKERFHRISIIACKCKRPPGQCDNARPLT